MTINQLITACKLNKISLDSEICLPGSPDFICEAFHHRTNWFTSKSNKTHEVLDVDQDDPFNENSAIVLDNKYGNIKIPFQG